MIETPRQLPLFAYGTLRPGCSNYRQFLSDQVVNERPAMARGCALYTHGSYPYAVPTRGETVTGSLLDIDPDAYPDVLCSLDQLEGYRAQAPQDSHYLRVARAVETLFMDFAVELVPAWIYEVGPTVDVESMWPIPGGDWSPSRTSASKFLTRRTEMR